MARPYCCMVLATAVLETEAVPAETHKTLRNHPGGPRDEVALDNPKRCLRYPSSTTEIEVVIER